ncbi:MAG: hypothetical protein QOG03_2275 [Actinomycetota bacterium]|nr:hypothetical protein [Actinomycetota bacterium]
MSPVLHTVAVLAGLILVAATLMSEIHTFVVPRAAQTRIPRFVFLAMRYLFRAIGWRSRTYEGTDRLFALYAPISLLVLPVVWMTMVATAYTVVYWGLSVGSWRAALETSGSSVFTLGFQHPQGLAATLVCFSEAGLGVGLLALLITYLPTMYASFQRRERMVAHLDVRAGTPPSAVVMLIRYNTIDRLDRIEALWEAWEDWFIDIEESHTSFAALPFFRSPQPNRSWVTAAGAMLDAAALYNSALDVPRSGQAQLTLRAGFISLRRIGDFFQIPYDPDPSPTDPIAVSRQEVDEVLDRLEAGGLPVKSDRDQVWADFAGWRVNYDAVLLGLAALTIAPIAPWSSDRSPPFHRPPVTRWGRRRASVD